MAAPTATSWTQWDGSGGLVYWRAEWTAGAPDNFTDSAVVDISTLAPAPSIVKVEGIQAAINGDLEATVEYSNSYSGTVDTTTLNTRVTWVSGDQFRTDWLTNGINKITVNAVEYTISSVDSATQITLTTDPGDQTGVAYDVDQLICVFEGQTSATIIDLFDFTPGPSEARTPNRRGANFVGDIIVSTANAAAADELRLLIYFKRKA